MKLIKYAITQGQAQLGYVNQSDALRFVEQAIASYEGRAYSPS